MGVLVRRYASKISSILLKCVTSIHKMICSDETCTIRKEPKPYGVNAARDLFGDIKLKVAFESPVVFDVGANCGSFIEKCSEVYKNPLIIAFEPIPDMYSVLNKKYLKNNNIKIFNFAVGNRNSTETFHVTENIVSSSILLPKEENLIYHTEGLSIKTKINVEMRKLSLFASEHEVIDLLKLDVQGYELEALRGLSEHIEKVKTILCEVEFFEVYKGQPLFAEIDLYLRERGFHLFNFYDMWTHEDGQVEAADALYLNGRYFSVGEDYKKLG